MPQRGGFPREFGQYRLERRLVCGGMSEVCLATRQARAPGAAPVVVKLLLEHLCDNERAVELFTNAASLAELFSHPNLVRGFEHGRVGGRPYLVMEYLAGHDLKTIMDRCGEQRRPIPLDVAIQLVSGLCDGLHYLHEFQHAGQPLDIVHRDVSPTNIMVGGDGAVKLLDFGLARAASFPDRSQPGALMGTPGYGAPEQLEGEVLDRRADVFSAAVVLHELLTGKRLFWRGNKHLTMLAVVEAEIPEVTSLRPELPAEVDAILHRALARDRQARYQTAQELSQTLDRFRARPATRLCNFVQELFPEPTPPR